MIITTNGIIGSPLPGQHVRADGKAFIGWANSSRENWISQVDEATGTKTDTMIGLSAIANRHSAPYIAVLPDGILFTVYGSHQSSHFVKLSIGVYDSTSWGTAISFPPTNVFYPTPIVTSEGAGTERIYIFYTRSTGAGGREACHSYTDNRGSSWSTPVVIVTTGTNQDVYNTVRKSTATGRILCGFTNGNPDQAGDFVNGYLAIYNPSDGSWKNVTGSTLSLPIAPSATTLVYDANANGGLNEMELDWIMVCQDDGSGNTYCSFTASHRAELSRNAVRAFWNGSSWAIQPILPANKTTSTVNGGFMNDGYPNIVYVSEKNPSTNIYDLFRFVTTDLGVTWVGTNLTNGTQTPGNGEQTIFYHVPIRGGSPTSTEFVTGIWNKISETLFDGIVYLIPIPSGGEPDPGSTALGDFVLRSQSQGSLILLDPGVLEKAYPDGVNGALLDITTLPVGKYLMKITSHRDSINREATVAFNVTDVV